MKDELFGFQRDELNKVRKFSKIALENYKNLNVPQVISMQAPTGSGKTIIMAAFIEDIFFGNVNYDPQPDAVFVWLSDSPQLNEQSKQKIDLKADKIRLNQCVVIDEESFDMEMFEDGHIYFLNTQKIGKSGNLCKHTDNRTYTIWETIQNTAKNKSDRLYFIIDEAHRGMQGNEASKATTIMQRFIMGKEDLGLDPLPLVIGMTATAERFNTLVGNTTSTLYRAVVNPADVRESGLLKDRILLEHPGDNQANNEYGILQAACEDYKNKCLHWYQYCYDNRTKQVNPIFIVQVEAGSENKVSNSDLDAILSTIEEKLGHKFKEGEVVHSFGGYGTIRICGLNIPYCEPVAIADNRLIKLVLFKETLSTGWDCPRAETMMSFRRAVDSTYIAQLLGRMIRTPLGHRIRYDEYLNDVRLFLPHFDMDSTKKIIEDLSANEGDNIPAAVDEEAIAVPKYKPYSVHTNKENKSPNQMSFENLGDETITTKKPKTLDEIWNEQNQKGNRDFANFDDSSNNIFNIIANEDKEDYISEDELIKNTSEIKSENKSESLVQKGFEKNRLIFKDFDREAVLKFINKSCFLSYHIKSVRINTYLDSLLKLAGLLTQTTLYENANKEVKTDIVKMIHDYVTKLHDSGTYDNLAKDILQFKLHVQIFDAFGKALENYTQNDLFSLADTDLDRLLTAAEAKLGSCGVTNDYGRTYFNPNNENEYKIDCVLFVIEEENLNTLQRYAKEKFHELNDKYRRQVYRLTESYQDLYNRTISNGDEVSEHNFSLPESIIFREDENGDCYTNHLFANEDGTSKIRLNGWEKDVIAEEEKRDDFVGWLRNPSREKWALCLPRKEGNDIIPFYPDFIIIRKDDNAQSGYVIDVLEPHNPNFTDNLSKAKALAEYANKELKVGRVQLIRQSKNENGTAKYKRLEMTKGLIREKVLNCMSIEELNHIFDTDGFFDE